MNNNKHKKIDCHKYLPRIIKKKNDIEIKNKYESRQW